MAELLAITGGGCVSPAGLGRVALAEALDGSARSIDWLTRFEPPEGAPSLAAECPDFDIETVVGSKKTYLDPSAKLFLAACALALEDARWDRAAADWADETALVYGTWLGPLESMAAFAERLAEKGPRYANPVLFSHVYVNAAPSLAAIEWGIRGPNLTLCSGWTSGFAALRQASDLLRLGRCRRALASASEALSPQLHASLQHAGLLADAVEPAAWQGRGGIVPGEAGASVALERSRDALGRGAPLLGFLLGCGEVLISDPREALERCLAEAAPLLGDSGIDVLISADSGLDAWRVAESTALGDRLIRTIRPGTLLGETFSAHALLGLLGGLALAPPGGSVLVLGLDPEGSAGWALARSAGGIA